MTAAVELAVSECHHQFRFDAWNCPDAAFGEGGDDHGSGNIISRDYRDFESNKD